MISAKKRQVIDELVKDILAKFPRVEYDGLWDKGDGTVGIRLWCNDRDSCRLFETFGSRLNEILEKFGYDLVLLTLDRAANGRAPLKKTRRQTTARSVKPAVA